VGKTIQDVNLALARDERNRVEIVQRALKPREITFPQLKVMIPATAVLVAGLYVLILFVREFLDQRVKYPSDLMSVPGKILGTVPERSDDPTNPKRAEMVVREASQSVLAENYRQLSAQVMKGMLVTGAKSLLVLSAMPEAGTTTVVLNLAACEAAVGRRVLIIGANMRRPGLSRALGINLGLPGLGEILSGADPASVVSTVSPNIDLISAGAPEHRVFERLSGDRLDEVLRWARDQYDFVIVDGPPSVVASEALTIANKVDASMIVTRAWKDQRGLVMKLAGQLLESRSQFLGVMLNRMRMTAGGYLRKNAEAMAEYAEHTTAFGGTDTAAEQTKRKAKPKAT
jgi:capsular exopolysaccharide synthesis family protein